MANTNVQNGLANFPFMGGAGGLRARLIDHDGPASYPTGGEVITAASLGMRSIAFVISTMSLSGVNYVEPYLGNKKSATSFKLMWTVVATGAQVANAVNLSTESCKLLVVGLP